MSLRFAPPVVLVCALGLAPAAELPQAPPPRDLAAGVDAIFAPWDRPDAPGVAVAVVRDGEVVYKRGFGLAVLEHRVPITPATAFNIGSVSKQFTAFAVLLLARDGRLSLDDPVRKHVGEVPDFGTPLTVRHLIHHTSGLREDWSLLALSGTRSEDVIREADVLRLVARQKELNFEPGSEYLYCNTGYDLLATVVKRVSGRSLRDFARDRIFRPAGMNDTDFCDDYRKVVPNRAWSYTRRPAGWFEHVHFATERAGPSNLFTTAEDLARWAVYTERMAESDPGLAADMVRPGQLNDGTELTYAAGLVVGRYRGAQRVAHGGTTAGYRATLHRYPRHRFAVAVLSNSAATNPEALAARVADVYLGSRLGPPAEPPKPAPKAARPRGPEPTAGELQALVGRYYSDELEVLYTVAVHDGRLTVAHPKGEAALRPAGKDEFEAAPGPDRVFDRVAFTRGPAGEVSGFKVSTTRARNVRFAKVELRPAR
jgi:CubicO group peptidase (beta-lactamase class C family)